MTGSEEEESAVGENLERLNENLARMEELSRRMVAALSQREQGDAGLEGPGHDLYFKAGMAYLNEMMTNPAKLMESQAQYWAKTLSHFAEAQQEFAKGNFAPPEDTTGEDRRFAHPMWKTHPYFNFVKQQYLISSQAIEEAIAGLDGLDTRDRQRIEFFSRQIIDLFAPTNYLATNPEALERALETEGQSLVDGLENLVRDIEINHGQVMPTLSDPTAFSLGENIATTKGAVIYRNRLIELIQYAPTTDRVKKTPLIIFPPWINKFYILDLKEKNSLIKWIVDQGYTLFIVSWKNPDENHAEIGLEDYVEEGYLAALDVVREITGEKQVNAVGYCIAGTTLSLALALMQRRKQKIVKSATFFTTLTDFADQGEFTAFLDDDFVDAIERQVAEKGYLDRYYMSRTFSFLRANDLVYGPAVRSYMMGEAPPAFDLLYWNGDGTNLPGRMAIDYLRGLCQGNALSGDGFPMAGEMLTLQDVTVPVFAIACETDHIAAWKDSYRGVQHMGSKNKTFLLSESGHIAGIVNPPSKKKYGHYMNPDLGLEAETWLETAEYFEGSWWPRWEAWLRSRSGAEVPARAVGESGYEILAEAPGTYVRETLTG